MAGYSLGDLLGGAAVAVARMERAGIETQAASCFRRQLAGRRKQGAHRVVCCDDSNHVRHCRNILYRSYRTPSSSHGNLFCFEG